MAGRFKLLTGPRDEARMTLIEHLDELRSRIIRVGAAFVAASAPAWFIRELVFDWLLAPAPMLEDSLNFTDVKISLYVGLMLTLPIVFYQVRAFVAPTVGETGQAFT